mmetsp:Transcript_1331/g.1402  ORF Transcript_1331/g.1402 Transcript_1331/m.1402 type:complete len:82 (+) Transcript_1331:326-571(+)
MATPFHNLYSDWIQFNDMEQCMESEYESKEEQQFGRYYCSRVVVTIVIIVIKIVMRQHHRYRNCDRGCLSPASKSRSMNGI